MFVFPRFTGPLTPSYVFHSFEDDDSLKKTVGTKLEKNDVAGAQRAAHQIFSYLDRDEAFQKICTDCLDKGDFAGAKEAASEIWWSESGQTALNKILDAEIEKNQFTDAIETCCRMMSSQNVIETTNIKACFRMIPSQSALEKVADKIKEAKPDPETMKEIEKAVSNKLCFFPNLQKIILNALMALFAALGNQSEVDRLQEKIEQLGRSIESSMLKSLKKPLALATGAWIGNSTLAVTGSLPLSCATSAVAALAVLYPSMRKSENVFGVGAGVAASAAGLATLPAVGVGLGTAFVSRIPLVQTVAKGTLNAGVSLVETGMNGVMWTGRTAFSLIDKTVDNIAIPLVKGTAHLVASTAVGLGNFIVETGSVALDCAGSVVNGVDSVLDTITFRK